MCRYQTLYHDDRTGYVVRCQECERIQVGFTNIMLTFNAEDFTSFRGWLGKIKEEHVPSKTETLRNIVIPTPCEGVKLLVSIRELNELDAMLETADTEMRSLELMKLFDSE